MDLDAATDELYGMLPEAFLPRRTELVADARTADDQQLANEISSLRKPSVGAWAVNHLVRTRPRDVDRLTDLASRLRSAQQSLDGAALKALGRERAGLVDALVHATVELARELGVKVSAAAARDVADTFVAALASPAATAAVVSGRLTRTLAYAGFGDVDVSDATARPLRVVPDPPAAAASSAVPDDSVVRAARRDEAKPAMQADLALEAAQTALRAAVAAATETAHQRSAAAAELDLAETRVAELTREMAQARASRDAAADSLATAEIADEAAQAQVQTARKALDTLRPD